LLFEQRDAQQFPVRLPVAAQGLPVDLGHRLGDLEREVVIASQFRYGLEFLAAAVQGEGAHEVASEQGVQITADEIRAGRAVCQDFPKHP